MDNKIDPASFSALVKSSPLLQSISLGGNPIKDFDDLKPLKDLKELFQLDLIKCPICEKADYRTKIFDAFPSLKVI